MIRLTSSAGKSDTLKLSRRDLGYVCGMRLANKSFNGGTTISGTMLLAHLAGIKIFGTGGLGGVHRGAESSMDISADLTELGRTPVTVISSGCKSFLDIARTIEYLETEGVGVGTFADGREGNVDFPAFWSRDSGVKSPTTIANEMEAAAIIRKLYLSIQQTSPLTLSRRPAHTPDLLRSALRQPCANRIRHSQRRNGFDHRRGTTTSQRLKHLRQR
jgi:pseudouridine-5'-phosphate glycosidase/pseudouridine kinase